jgi:hypothetical protein
MDDTWYASSEMVHSVCYKNNLELCWTQHFNPFPQNQNIYNNKIHNNKILEINKHHGNQVEVYCNNLNLIYVFVYQTPFICNVVTIYQCVDFHVDLFK